MLDGEPLWKDCWVLRQIMEYSNYEIFLLKLWPEMY